MAKLTPRQANFISEYLKTGNATRAAIDAGYPESSAHVTGARLLKNAKVKAAVGDRLHTAGLTVERVLLELMRLGLFDSGKLYDEHGNRIPVHLLDEDTRRAVAMIEDEVTEGPGFVTTRKQRVKMADKGQSLERLGRYLKMFTDRIEHDGRVTLEQLITGETKAA